MKKLAFHWKILIGLVLGIAWALLSAAFHFSEFTLDWIAPFGDIFIRLLKLIALPLVLFSIIKGISGLPNARSLGRLGWKTLLAYLVTTVFAVTIGLLLVNIVRPGEFTPESKRISNRLKYEIWAADSKIPTADGKHFLDDPANRELADEIRARMQLEQPDEDINERIETAEKRKGAGPLQFVVEMVPDNFFHSLNDNGLMLQVIFFAIFFGVTLLLIPHQKAAPVISVVDGITEVFLKMVDVVMRAAPFFVFALMAGQMANLAGDDIGAMIAFFQGLGFYALTLVAGLLFLIFFFYPMLMRFFVRKVSYRQFFNSIGPAQLLAFSTSSSAATLPVTMECVHENLGVSEDVSSFVLPVGATVNMDGTSMYQAIAVIFLAQLHMVDLDLGAQLTIVLTATLASIGAAAVPSAGLVMMILVLGAVGLPPFWIALIFPIDRPLDMCRTVVNVTGDATVSSIIATSEGEMDFKPSSKKSIT